MPDDDLPQIARETEVTFKSKIGYSYDGTVTAGPDDHGDYTIVTEDGATALVDRDRITVKGEPGQPDDPSLTGEQRASLRADRGRTHATTRITDAMQSVFSLLREDAKQESGSDIEDDALDDLRLQAADLVVEEAEVLRAGLVRTVEAKRA